MEGARSAGGRSAERKQDGTSTPAKSASLPNRLGAQDVCVTSRHTARPVCLRPDASLASLLSTTAG